MSRRTPLAALLVLATIGTAALSGCSIFAEPEPEATPSAEPTEPPAKDDPAHDGEFNAEGTAEDNLDIFTAVMKKVWKSDDRTKGSAYVDALVEAGFDKSQMQVTADISTVQLPAESIMFSVKWGDECLIGQVGPETGDPIAAVEDVVADGACLIGNTRDIDW